VLKKIGRALGLVAVRHPIDRSARLGGDQDRVADRAVRTALCGEEGKLRCRQGAQRPTHEVYPVGGEAIPLGDVLQHRVHVVGNLVEGNFAAALAVADAGIVEQHQAIVVTERNLSILVGIVSCCFSDLGAVGAVRYHLRGPVGEDAARPIEHHDQLVARGPVSDDGIFNGVAGPRVRCYG
jgi:hypothetical protein